MVEDKSVGISFEQAAQWLESTSEETPLVILEYNGDFSLMQPCKISQIIELRQPFTENHRTRRSYFMITREWKSRGRRAINRIENFVFSRRTTVNISSLIGHREFVIDFS